MKMRYFLVEFVVAIDLDCSYKGTILSHLCNDVLLYMTKVEQFHTQRSAGNYEFRFHYLYSATLGLPIQLTHLY